MKKTLIIAALCAAALAVGGCATTPVQSAAPAGAGGGTTCKYTASGQAARAVDLPKSTGVPNTGTTTMTLMLNDKPVPLTLDRAKAPCTVNSFVSLAGQGYFDGTACHRLTDAGGLYVLQCGDPTGTGAGGPGYAFADETAGITGYPAGTIAMANAGPNTNGSQFFIVYQDSQLPPNYTVFGSIDGAGLAVVKAIAAQGQDNSFGAAGGGKPNAPATITSVSAG